MPIIKNKSSLLLAARGTYTNWVLAPLRKTQPDLMLPNYLFYDFNGKYSHKINNKNKLQINWYSGYDYFSVLQQESYEPKLTGNVQMNQQNHLLSITNNAILSPKLVLNASFNYSQFYSDHRNKLTYTDYPDSLFADIIFSATRIHDYALNLKLNYSPNNQHFIKTGITPKLYKLTPWMLNTSQFFNAETLDDLKVSSQTYTAHQITAFAEDEWHINEKLNINAGARLSYFNHKSTSYIKPEPRVSVRYAINSKLSLKGGYSKMNQFLQVLENNANGLSPEVWVLSDSVIKPQSANQLSAGLFGEWKGLEYGIEAYAKRMDDLIFYIYGVASELGTDWQSEINRKGKGQSGGIEFYLQKQAKQYFVAASYTISKTNYTFGTVNFGNTFAPSHDHLHDFSVVLNYKPNKKHELGFNWVFSTGAPFTVPEVNIPDSYFFRGQYYGYGGINNARLPNYHRLDVSWKRSKPTTWGGEKYWLFSFYNIYARQNPIIVSFHPERGATKHTMFTIVPSINWGLRF